MLSGDNEKQSKPMEAQRLHKLHRNDSKCVLNAEQDCSSFAPSVWCNG